MWGEPLSRGMEEILAALPGQPLTPEAVEALDDAASAQLVPVSWSGAQVVTLLVDQEGQLTGGRFEPPGSATASRARSFGSEDVEGADEDDVDPESAGPSGFETGERGPIGTVEVVESSQVPTGNPFADVLDDDGGLGQSTAIGGDGAPAPESSGQLWALGYDPDAATWVLIGEVDGTTVADAEGLVEEWLAETYSEAMLDRITVGPSEYDSSA